MGRLEEDLRLFESKKSVPHLGLAQKRVGLDDRNTEGATRMKMELRYDWELELQEQEHVKPSMQRSGHLDWMHVVVAEVVLWTAMEDFWRLHLQLQVESGQVCSH